MGTLVHYEQTVRDRVVRPYAEEVESCMHEYTVKDELARDDSETGPSPDGGGEAGSLFGEPVTMDIFSSFAVGPGRYCSPRQRMPSNEIN